MDQYGFARGSSELIAVRDNKGTISQVDINNISLFQAGHLLKNVHLHIFRSFFSTKTRDREGVDANRKISQQNFDFA